MELNWRRTSKGFVYWMINFFAPVLRYSIGVIWIANVTFFCSWMYWIYIAIEFRSSDCVSRFLLDVAFIIISVFNNVICILLQFICVYQFSNIFFRKIVINRKSIVCSTKIRYHQFHFHHLVSFGTCVIITISVERPVQLFPMIRKFTIQRLSMQHVTSCSLRPASRFSNSFFCSFIWRFQEHIDLVAVLVKSNMVAENLFWSLLLPITPLLDGMIQYLKSRIGFVFNF